MPWLLDRRSVFDFLFQRHNKVCHSIPDIMEYFWVGKDYQQSDWPNDQAASRQWRLTLTCRLAKQVCLRILAVCPGSLYLLLSVAGGDFKFPWSLRDKIQCFSCLIKPALLCLKSYNFVGATTPQLVLNTQPWQPCKYQDWQSEVAVRNWTCTNPGGTTYEMQP